MQFKSEISLNLAFQLGMDGGCDNLPSKNENFLTLEFKIYKFQFSLNLEESKVAHYENTGAVRFAA